MQQAPCKPDWLRSALQVPTKAQSITHTSATAGPCVWSSRSNLGLWLFRYGLLCCGNDLAADQVHGIAQRAHHKIGASLREALRQDCLDVSQRPEPDKDRLAWKPAPESSNQEPHMRREPWIEARQAKDPYARD